MKPEERLSFLVDLLEGGSQKKFAEKCGIDTASLSRAINGKANAEHYFPQVMKAYPEVRWEWLYKGKGEPTKKLEEKSRMEKKLDALTKEVKRLSALVEELTKKV